MIEGETYVLEAVRDTLRKKLSLSDAQCDCEFDEQVPSIAADNYFAVLSGGIEVGPNHNPSGGVHDILHSVQVMVIQRRVVARDQSRSVFLRRLHGINAELGRVIQALDYQNDVMSLANAMMYRDHSTSAPFIETLRLLRVDSKPRMVNSELFAGKSQGGQGTTPWVAMVRSVYLGRMRRMQTILQVGVEGRV